MESFVNMSAKANAFSIAQLLDSNEVDVQQYVSAKNTLGEKWTSSHQIELDLEGDNAQMIYYLIALQTLYF